MAAFHSWMIIRYRDEFQIAEDAEEAFERAYRDSIEVIKGGGREVETFLLNALIKAYEEGIISPDAGFRRRDIRL
jgi:hypothetical protein